MTDIAATDPLLWIPLQSGCATSITVAPNDVIWVAGCDGAADHSIWYMRNEPSCVEGICDDLPAWHDNRGSGNHVAIDRAGGAMTVTASGVVFEALGRDVTDRRSPDFPNNLPTARWQRAFQTDRCVNEIELYEESNEGAMAFETPGRTIDQFAFRYLATQCDPDSAGNSSVIRRIGKDHAFSVVPGRVRTLALFYRLFGGDRLSQTFWGLTAGGSMWLYNDNMGEFHEGGFVQMPQPPSFTYDITDHFAASNDGIYQWNDDAQRWDRYMDNETVGGPVKQIAHAGAVRVVRADGTAEVVGPSRLWAIDHGGAIYYAGRIGNPR